MESGFSEGESEGIGTADGVELRLDAGLQKEPSDALAGWIGSGADVLVGVSVGVGLGVTASAVSGTAAAVGVGTTVATGRMVDCSAGVAADVAGDCEFLPTPVVPEVVVEGGRRVEDRVG